MNSAARNAGVLLAGYETDYNDISRDADPDIGAFEFGTLPPLVGDMDFDGDVDFDDISGFVLGLSDPVVYENIYGQPPSFHGDMDGDGDHDFDDIDELVAILTA